MIDSRQILRPKSSRSVDSSRRTSKLEETTSLLRKIQIQQWVQPWEETFSISLTCQDLEELVAQVFLPACKALVKRPEATSLRCLELKLVVIHKMVEMTRTDSQADLVKPIQLVPLSTYPLLISSSVQACRALHRTYSAR